MGKTSDIPSLPAAAPAVWSNFFVCSKLILFSFCSHGSFSVDLRSSFFFFNGPLKSLKHCHECSHFGRVFDVINMSSMSVRSTHDVTGSPFSAVHYERTSMAVSLGAQIQSRKVLLLHKWWCLPRCEDFGGWLSNAVPACAFFFLKVEISSRTLILLLTPGSVHSGSVSSDDCGQVFPD